MRLACRRSSVKQEEYGTKPSEFAYDALDRRVHKTVTCTPNLDTPPEGEYYYYAGSRIIDRYADAYFASRVGGLSQVGVRTSQGRRVIDQLSENIASEVKLGYVGYDQRVVSQIRKDAEIVRERIENIKGAHWHFYRSSNTGKIGADQRILDLLDAHDIGYTIHD